MPKEPKSNESPEYLDNLRNQFAGQAMKSLINRPWSGVQAGDFSKFISKLSYEIADEMMIARIK